MKRYSPKEIEPKWQKTWMDQKTFQVTEDSSKPKKYIIDMFPYPSGAAMHVGHVRNFTISDVLSQYHRQKGYNVMHTMGWDTFGLPAENYAIKTGTPPQETTKANIANFKHQLQQLGMSYDWSREVNTSDPEYYKWTQWIFTQLFENDLAYQNENPQWWCPVDKTVLANEQVEAGRCWRCGNEVIKKNLKQWFFRTTAYADQLLDGIDDLNWPEKIKTMQRNWIGKSKGAQVTFDVEDGVDIAVFTTRPDTLFGATFLVLAPEHELVSKITTPDQKASVDAYVKQAQAKSDIERQENKKKTGVFTGAYAVNPVSQEKIPVWIADYVLATYGTGAIMAVPAHDQRDHEFAEKFNLPIINVVDPSSIREDAKEHTSFVEKRSIVAVVVNDKEEILTINWGSKYGGRLLIGGTIDNNEDAATTAVREVTEETGYTDLEVTAVSDETYLYKYFAFSKNEAHSIETKIVFIRLNSDAKQEQNLDESEKNKFKVEWVTKAVADKEIVEPLHRYGFEKYILGKCFSGEGVVTNSGSYDGLMSSEAREKIVADLEKDGKAKEEVNYKIRDWLISRQRYWGAPIPIIHCEKDGAVAVPKADLPVRLPDLANFEPTGEGSALAAVEDWVNTTCPKCGGPAKRETDTMDGYACSSWYFLRYADPSNADMAWDPAKANYWLPIDYYCGGDHAVSHLLYSRFWMRFFADQGWIEKSRQEPVGTLVYNGYILAADGTKMSKSKGNVVNPDDLIEQGYGADSVRLFEMFIAPYDQNTSWNTNGVPGTFRFLQRVWVLVHEFLESEKDDKPNQEVLRVINRTIEQVSRDLDRLSFNTAVSSLMESVNSLYKIKADGFTGSESWQTALENLVQLLAPFAPHISEELWQTLGHNDSVHTASWPVHDPKYLVADTVTVVVQVNGKVRAQLTLPADSSKEDAEAAARADEKVASYLTGDVKKTIYVPNRLISFVL